MSASGSAHSDVSPASFRRGRAHLALFWAKQRVSLVLGTFLTVSMVILWLSAGLVTRYGPTENNFRERLQPPSAEHVMGTDNFGRDVFSRVIHGIGVSLSISLPVVVITGVLGTLLGMLCIAAPPTDWPMMRLTDSLLAFPGLLLAIAVAATLGPSIPNAIIALSLTFLPRTVLTMRAAMLGFMDLEFVAAARLAGTGATRIMLRHVLPNVLPVLIVQQTFVFALAILSEAVLSFLGIGAIPPTPSLGNIIADGRDYIPVAPWISFYPGIAIATLVLGLNLLGDGLRDFLDPKIKIAVR